MSLPGKGICVIWGEREMVQRWKTNYLLKQRFIKCIKKCNAAGKAMGWDRGRCSFPRWLAGNKILYQYHKHRRRNVVENRNENKNKFVTKLSALYCKKRKYKKIGPEGKKTKISNTNEFLILKQCSLWKHMMKIMMSSKITASMLHGKEQGSHYRGSMTDMRWPLTLGKRLVPNESRAERGRRRSM